MHVMCLTLWNDPVQHWSRLVKIQHGPAPQAVECQNVFGFVIWERYGLIFGLQFLSYFISSFRAFLYKEKQSVNAMSPYSMMSLQSYSVLVTQLFEACTFHSIFMFIKSHHRLWPLYSSHLRCFMRKTSWLKLKSARELNTELIDACLQAVFR